MKEQFSGSISVDIRARKLVWWRKCYALVQSKQRLQPMVASSWISVTMLSCSLRVLIPFLQATPEVERTLMRAKGRGSSWEPSPSSGRKTGSVCYSRASRINTNTKREGGGSYGGAHVFRKLRTPKDPKTSSKAELLSPWSLMCLRDGTELVKPAKNQSQRWWYQLPLLHRGTQSAESKMWEQRR